MIMSMEDGEFISPRDRLRAKLPSGSEFPFTPKDLEFPHKNPIPDGKNARELREALERYWIWGVQKFTLFYLRPVLGDAVRRIEWDVLNPDKTFTYTLRQIGKKLNDRNYDDVRKTRQALKVGTMPVQDDKGEWVFTQEELLQLIIGVFAYGEARRRERIAQKRKMPGKYGR